ncbi:MAG TPA: serine/threonine-protein kinase, partial [Planctomycetota bacterium]|nr:serine/threonine-protein kinase [Planctomycetota bacterium]
MRTIAGYTLEAKLGEGGMGTVFKATHPRFPGRTFALKVLRAAGPPSAQALARFQREAEALARVAAHPNVVRLLGAGVEQNQPYYVMEFVQGKSLADLVEQKGPLEPVQAAKVVADVTRAIAHAHRQGILHRDLKPENVLVDGERVLVCDFGLAKIAEEERLTRSGTLLGTPAYAAPEQLSVKGALDQRADVYGLGGILMFLLTGAPPFEATTLHEAMAAAFAAPVPPPSSRRSGISADMDAIVLRALAKLPAQRYQSALELLEDLDKFARGVPLERRRGHAGRRVALGVFLLAAAAVASFVVPKLREGATGKGGPSNVTPHEDPEAALAAVASRSPSERAAKLLELGDALVARGASLDLVGEKGGSGAGLVLLEETHRARVEGRSSADALFALAARIARTRLERDSADPAARELRALASLASRGAATSALGKGRVVAEIDASTAADLAAATTLAGAAGRRAAWLLVERHVCERRPDEARSALERAAHAFPDPALEEAFKRVLASDPPATVFASLRDRVTGTKEARVEAAAELARFLALQ